MKSIILKVVGFSILLFACNTSTGLSPQNTKPPQPPLQFTETDPALSPSPEQPIGKWDLWSSGKTLLRGANISQGIVILELDGPTFKGPGPVGPPYTQADFDRLAELGANYVSISGPGIFSIELPYKLLPEIVEYYDELLAMIETADMFATIGFRTGPGRSDWGICCANEDWAQPYLNDTVWGDVEAQAAWSEMWTYAAVHFRDNPLVVGYLLMVEPNPAAIHFDIYEAEEFFGEYRGTTYDWNSFYPGIVQAIREVDRETPILVGGMNFSSIVWLPYLEPVNAERIVYVVDQYASFTYTHQDEEDSFTYPGRFDTDFDGAADDFDQTWLEALFAPLDEFVETTGAPITIDEYGLVRWAPDGAIFLDDQMVLFEERGMNYAVWEWASGWSEYNDVVNAFNFRFGPDPANIQDTSNEIQDTLISYWAQNDLRPSNVRWTGD